PPSCLILVTSRMFGTALWISSIPVCVYLTTRKIGCVFLPSKTGPRPTTVASITAGQTPAATLLKRLRIFTLKSSRIDSRYRTHVPSHFLRMFCSATRHVLPCTSSRIDSRLHVLTFPLIMFLY